MKEFILYKNEVFWLQKSGKYYCSGRKDKTKERLLHRRIWEEHKGKIPPDHHIHHIDDNWKNNDITNLECIPRSEHLRLHILERFSCDEYRKSNKKQLKDAQKNAKKWHASEEGREWHSKNAKMQNEKRGAEKYFCANCKKEFYSKSFGKVFCCSLRCTIKLRNNKAKTKFESECRNCGKKFKHPKLIGKIRYKGCSRACSISIKKNNHV